MRNLANAVRFADSFSLLFVRCNQRSRQKEIIEELKGQLAEYKIKVIFLENQIEHLLDELQERLGDEKPDAVFVYGLESSFPKADTAAESKFVVTLNHSRNSFKKVLNCPLVLFLPEYALSAIYHGATDFYSIRSGIFLFSAKAEETEFQILQHTLSNNIELEGLLFEERQNRIKTIKDLLDEYQSLPDLHRNFKKEFKLKGKLAVLYDISNENLKAIKLCKEIIAYARKSEDSDLLSSALNSLGLIYRDQGKYKEALKLINESLEIKEKTIGTRHPDYASVLANLGGTYFLLNNYDKAIELLNESLKIYEETIGTKHPLYVMSLGNLALVYKTQGKHEEAVNLYKKALDIDREVINTNHPSYALRLANLSVFYYEQQKYQEALALAKEAYQIRRRTLGVNHQQTKELKNEIKLIKSKLKEKACLLVPHKK